MTGPRAIFRCDASPAIGGGHVMRCLALARMLLRSGWRVGFAHGAESVDTAPALATISDRCIAEGSDSEALRRAWPKGVDLLVIDHYGLDAGYGRALRGWAGRILAIDDKADRSHECDFLLDQTYGRAEADYRPLVPEGCKLLLGSAYALVDESFCALRPQALARREREEKPARILVSCGMIDGSDATGLALNAVAEADLPDLAIDVAIGAKAPHLDAIRARLARFGGRGRLLTDHAAMAELMAKADIGIGAAGTSSWERCCLGLPSIAMVTYDNQRAIGRALAQSGAALVPGGDGLPDRDVLAETIKNLVSSPRLCKAIARNAEHLCDGMGGERILAECGLIAPGGPGNILEIKTE